MNSIVAIYDNPSLPAVPRSDWIASPRVLRPDGCRADKNGQDAVAHVQGSVTARKLFSGPVGITSNHGLPYA